MKLFKFKDEWISEKTFLKVHEEVQNNDGKMLYGLVSLLTRE